MERRLSRRARPGLTTLIGVPAGVGDDLVEDVGELQLVLVARDVADVRRADDVVHAQQRVGRDRAAAPPRTRRPPPCPAGRRAAPRPARRARSARARLVLTSSAVGFMRRQVGGGDDAARRRHEPHVQRDDVALLEERLAWLAATA